MDTLQSRMLKFYKSFREDNFAHLHSFMQLCPKSPVVAVSQVSCCCCVPSSRCWPQFFPQREKSQKPCFFVWCYHFIILNILSLWTGGMRMKVFAYTYEAKESNMNLSVVPQSQCGHIIITTSNAVPRFLPEGFWFSWGPWHLHFWPIPKVIVVTRFWEPKNWNSLFWL